jgi:DNA repair protein RadC
VELPEQHLSITSWASEDRPREKLLAKGRQALSNAELVAILIGSGTKKESAVDLSKRILASINNDLHQLGKLEVKDLQKFKGIGEAKAISIVAALELGRRRKSTEVKKKDKVTSSGDAYDIMKGTFLDLKHEQFWILLLDRSNQVISRQQISSGGVAGTVVDARLIFKPALELLASGIILFHNHPSGNLKPSKQDLELTKKLVSGARNIDMNILDHLIISERGYLSFKDEGYL